MSGTIRVKVPELLEQQDKDVRDLLYGARLAPGTAYAWARGEVDGLTFDVLIRICEFFGVGVDEVLEYIPEGSSSKA